MPDKTATTYRCFSCGEDIVDCVYLVPRRKVRPLKTTLSTGVVIHNPPDAVDGSHAGIVVGPENDPHCQTCYDNLPTVQELIDAYKK